LFVDKGQTFYITSDGHFPEMESRLFSEEYTSPICDIYVMKVIYVSNILNDQYVHMYSCKYLNHIKMFSLPQNIFELLQILVHSTILPFSGSLNFLLKFCRSTFSFENKYKKIYSMTFLDSKESRIIMKHQMIKTSFKQLFLTINFVFEYIECIILFYVFLSIGSEK